MIERKINLAGLKCLRDKRGIVRIGNAGRPAGYGQPAGSIQLWEEIYERNDLDH
jgi:hypothetical protein